MELNAFYGTETNGEITGGCILETRILLLDVTAILRHHTGMMSYVYCLNPPYHTLKVLCSSTFGTNFCMFGQ